MRSGGKAGDRASQGGPTGIPFQKKALPPREGQIARIVFKHREVTARIVCDALEGQVTNAAVRSMLQRLIGKGILRRDHMQVSSNRSTPDADHSRLY
jgi:hypothetical protein